MHKTTIIRLRAAALLGALALALAGCFMSPGKFTSELAITGPDSFTFRYDGEIFFLGLSKLAQMSAAAEETFKPADCTDPETYEVHECTAEELTKQRAEWDAAAPERAAKAKREAEQMAALMGGIDPSDPKAADELVRLLQRQRGWERVVHKGDGLFEVSYRASGSLGHDFSFPVIEGFPQFNPFVQVYLRKGGQLRVNAPGFAAQSGDGTGFGSFLGMGALASLASMGVTEAGGGDKTSQAFKSVPTMEGSFTVRTAPGMRILANNTDEGPAAGTPGEVLTWKITSRTSSAPTALIAAQTP